jgi:hypothetical protein
MVQLTLEQRTIVIKTFYETNSLQQTRVAELKWDLPVAFSKLCDWDSDNPNELWKLVMKG